MTDKTLYSGSLRHRIAIQERLEEQDTDTGEITHVWVTVTGMESVPAEIVPLSAKEYIAAQAVQSEIAGRIVIRYREGVTAAMRALYRGRALNLKEPLEDPKTGLTWLTIPYTLGANDG